MHIRDLPIDTILHCFSFLCEANDICTICLTCTQWSLLHNSNNKDATFTQEYLFTTYYENRWKVSDDFASGEETAKTKYITRHILNNRWIHNRVTRQLSFEGHLETVNRCELMNMDRSGNKFSLFSYGQDFMFEWSIQSGKWLKQFLPNDTISYYLMINGGIYPNRQFGYMHTMASFACVCYLYGVSSEELFESVYNPLPLLDASETLEDEKFSIIELHIRNEHLHGIVTYEYKQVFKLKSQHTTPVGNIVARTCHFLNAIESEYPLAMIIDASNRMMVYTLEPCSPISITKDSMENYQSSAIVPCSNIVDLGIVINVKFIHEDTTSYIVACSNFSGIQLFRIEYLCQWKTVTIRQLADLSYIQTVEDEKQFCHEVDQYPLFISDIDPSQRKPVIFTVMMMSNSSAIDLISTRSDVLNVQNASVITVDDVSQRAAVGTRNGSIITFKRSRCGSWNIEHEFNGHEGQINLVKIIDTEKMVTASSDRSLRVWSLIDSSCLFTQHNVHMNKIEDVTFNERYLVSASRDTTLLLTDFSVPPRESEIFEQLKSNSSPVPTSCLTPPAQIHTERVPIVLVITGAFSPIHRMHINSLDIAAEYLQSEHNFQVVGRYISPAHDSYNKAGLLPCYHRIRMAQMACEEYMEESREKGKPCLPVAVSVWEATQKVFHLQHEVLDHIYNQVNEYYRNQFRFPKEILVAYVCGSDLASRMSLHKLLSNHCVAVIERLGDEFTHRSPFIDQLVQTHMGKNLFMISKHRDQTLVEVSSTKVKELARTNQWDQLYHLTYLSVIQYMKQHNLLL